MMSININSNIKIDSKWDEFALSRAGFLAKLWTTIPVYLLDEDLMDKIYPPHRSRLLDPECVKKLLEREKRREEERLQREINNPESRQNPNYPRNDDNEEDDYFWRNIGECIKDMKGGLCVAMAVYVKSFSKDQIDAIEDAKRQALASSETYRMMMENETLKNFFNNSFNPIPSIFICPERVEHWSRSTKVLLPQQKPDKIFMIHYAGILLHELCHAFNDTDMNTYDEIWGRTIEESLCNAVMCSRFEKTDKAIISVGASLMPFLEYKGWTFWAEFEKDSIKSFGRNWGGNKFGKRESCLVAGLPVMEVLSLWNSSVYAHSMGMRSGASGAMLERIRSKNKKTNNGWGWKAIAQQILIEALNAKP